MGRGVEGRVEGRCILGWENIPRTNICDHASNSAICPTFAATFYLEQLLPGNQGHYRISYYTSNIYSVLT